MEIQINNKHTIEFKKSENGWEGKVFLFYRPFYFYIEELKNINWEEVKNRLSYFEKHCLEIIDITEKGIKQHLKYLGWDTELEFDLDFVSLPIEKNTEEYIIVEPDFYDDPYVSWSVHIIHNNGPKLKKVLRQ